MSHYIRQCDSSSDYPIGCLFMHGLDLIVLKWHENVPCHSKYAWVYFSVDKDLKWENKTSQKMKTEVPHPVFHTCWSMYFADLTPQLADK